MDWKKIKNLKIELNIDDETMSLIQSLSNDNDEVNKIVNEMLTIKFNEALTNINKLFDDKLV